MKSNERSSRDVEDFCEIEGISRTSFYEEVKRGLLAVAKIGRRTVIFEEERLRWRAAKLAEARRLAKARREANEQRAA